MSNKKELQSYSKINHQNGQIYQQGSYMYQNPNVYSYYPFLDHPVDPYFSDVSNYYNNYWNFMGSQTQNFYNMMNMPYNQVKMESGSLESLIALENANILSSFQSSKKLQSNQSKLRSINQSHSYLVKESANKCQSQGNGKNAYKWINFTKINGVSQEIQPFVKIFTDLTKNYIYEVDNFDQYVKICWKKLEQHQKSSQKLKDLFAKIINQIQKKYKRFCKTKQEIIKYIIRKFYHNIRSKKKINFKSQYQQLMVQHQKNLSFYKSMNKEFLKKQFQSNLFNQIFRQFYANIEDEFKQQNDERVNNFAYILAVCWTNRSIKALSNEKKLPWLMSEKNRIKKVANDLMKTYGRPMVNKQY